MVAAQVRVILEKIEAKLAKYHQVELFFTLEKRIFDGIIIVDCESALIIFLVLNQDNILVKATMCFCKCCFWCLEKFMKFLNRCSLKILSIWTFEHWTFGHLNIVQHVLSWQLWTCAILSQERLHHVCSQRDQFLLLGKRSFLSSFKVTFFFRWYPKPLLMNLCY